MGLHTRALAAQRRWRIAQDWLDRDRRAAEAAMSNRKRRFYRDLWQQAAEAIGADCEDMGYGFRRIGFGPGKRTWVKGGEVMLDDHVSLKLAANKPLIHQHLTGLGLRCPRYAEYTLETLEVAARFLDQLDGPAVVKPADGGAGGRGVTTGIDSTARLREASVLASTQDRQLLIEEQVPGSSYRLLYLGGELIDAIERRGPSVVGDGNSKLDALIYQENARRQQGGEIVAMNRITRDLELDWYFTDTGLDLAMVPEAGQPVALKRVCNQNSDRDNSSVLDQLHPQVAAAGKRIVDSLGLELIGVDLIATTLAEPLEASGAVVNEINTTPGLQHHELLADRSRRQQVPEQILRYILDRHPRP